MLRMLDGRAVVRGEMPHVGLSHLSGVHTDQPWPWAYEVLVRKKEKKHTEWERRIMDE